MRPPTTWPEATLDDVVIKASPTEELYGYDHAPTIPSDPADVAARCRQVVAELEDTFAILDPLLTLAALAVLQTTSRIGSQTLFLDAPDLEFAQAAFLQTGGGEIRPSLSAIVRLCNNLRLFRALLLHGKKFEPNTSEWSLHQRRQETLNVRHTHFGPTARHLAKMITEHFGSRRSTQLGFSLSQASGILFQAADLVVEGITAKSASEAIASWANGSLSGTISESNWEMLVAIFEVHAQSLSEQGACAEFYQIEKILNVASIGQIENTKLEYLSLDNPVWSAPVFKARSGKYYLFCPALIFSFNDYQMTRILGP